MFCVFCRNIWRVLTQGFDCVGNEILVVRTWSVILTPITLGWRLCFHYCNSLYGRKLCCYYCLLCNHACTYYGNIKPLLFLNSFTNFQIKRNKLTNFKSEFYFVFVLVTNIILYSKRDRRILLTCTSFDHLILNRTQVNKKKGKKHAVNNRQNKKKIQSLLRVQSHRIKSEIRIELSGYLPSL